MVDTMETSLGLLRGLRTWVVRPTTTSRSNLRLLLILLVLPAIGASSPQKQAAIEGVVKDQSGAPIAGAGVSFKSKSEALHTVTDDTGKFQFQPASIAAAAVITVQADGFSTLQQAWPAGADANSPPLEFVLAPTAIADQVTITAARTESRVSDTAASVVVLSEHDLQSTAALTLDDILKQIEGFSLFRRTSSRTENPTAQGVSLRGLGASGASRAVVLADGIPLNDPFGGWIYWDRVPREAIGRIEVLEGGASNLYGTDALSGVINVIRKDDRDWALSMETSYGNENTPDTSLYTTFREGDWIARLGAEAFYTNGYIIVEPSERGRVDTPAGSGHGNIEVTLERLIADRGRVFVRASDFQEDRRNGTPVQTNNTHIREVAAGADYRTIDAGQFVLRAYGSTQLFDQDFSAVAADRNSESLTDSQRVPAQRIGFSAQWSLLLGTHQTVVAGVDGREVHGASDELKFFSGAVTSAVDSGGRERIVGVFGEDLIRLAPSWLLTVGARVDYWDNYDALSATQPLSHPGPEMVVDFADRTDSALSPRVSLLHRLNQHITLSTSVYRAFRAPTLNELYRDFRVGNIITDANPDLRAERLTGWEAAGSITEFHDRLNIRGTFFWNNVADAIADITELMPIPPPAPGTILQQRENLGSTRSYGVQVDATVRVAKNVTVSGGYQFLDSRVASYAASPAIVNNLLPQVPQNQFTIQTRYTNPSIITIGVQARFVGNQFDNDLNTLALGSLFTVDVLAERRVTRNLDVFAAVENLFNYRYAVARDPVRELGAPFLARVGLRLHIGSGR
jgi:outer membrane receptor protein involved in Fe transport